MRWEGRRLQRGTGREEQEGELETAMAEGDEEIEKEACVGSLCFLQPHPLYLPPPFYRKILGRDYRWKVGAKLRTGPGLQVKVQRAITFPNCMGLDEDARWRWQHIPLSIQSGLKLDTWLHRQEVTEDPPSQKDPRAQTFRLFPYTCVKLKSPVFGKLALRPVLELLPVPALILKRQFSIGAAKVTLRANLEMASIKAPQWTLQINWQKDAARLAVEPMKDAVGLHYSKIFNLFKDSKAVATGSAEVPSMLIFGGISSAKGSLPVRFRLESLKISQIFGTRAVRETPRPAYDYRQAAKFIGANDTISVVPGHWIDCHTEPGAQGEREFNMEVANVLEKELRMNGWDVLRPDRDAPHLSWEEYLNWVSRQTLMGIPVLEIHGQGSNADYRGHVLGVIGDHNAPLSKELASTFGQFQMDWRELGVPRRGGLIVESFNSDEVLQMKPWHRTWAVRRLSNQIVSAIERASAPNRAPRGLIVDLDAYANLPLERSSISATKR